MNSRAFELLTDVWDDSANLRRVVPFAHEASKPPRRSWLLPSPSKVLAAAAVLVLAVAVGLHFTSHGVTTEIGEQRLLSLEDGSRVFMNTETRVAVHYTEHTRSVELISGEALFDVAKDPSKPFIVKVGDRRVRALGTSFVVRQDAAALAVTLVEGKVDVAQAPDLLASIEHSMRPATSTSAAVISLTPGQRLLIREDHTAAVDKVSVDNALAWRRGQVILNDTPLANAIAEMNRYSRRKIVLQAADAAHLITNGLFQAGDSSSFAQAIAQHYGLRVIERPQEIALVELASSGSAAR